MADPSATENTAVCIRVRPLNERETRAGDACALSCVPKLNVVSLLDPVTGAPLGGKGNVFQYDEIFDAASDSRAIYERVARRIVHSTLNGINGSIFAYGQTSSGKTYTMQGDGGMPFETEDETLQPGILQLAVEDIFNYIESCTDRDFLLRVSFLEIYNEVVKDLLNPTETGANLKLREDPRKGVYVESKEEIITNYEDIVTLLQTGNQNRTTGQTAMNDKSSRSHSVFRIVIESKQKSDSRRHSEEDVNGAVLVASLNLVDLAGSESLRHTGAEGIRQREAGNINKSLLTLARVINSLASSGGSGQNAPFRDSKLTRLLQNSLGGNTRTLIVCCVTPSDRYIEETKSTLQFAARAKDIKTSATVNEVLDDQTQLRRLKREVHELKKLVNSEALNALKAENEALLSEKTYNKTEMARLMGLILSSSSVTKAAVGKKRKQRGKRTRETWGPGDFPANIKALAPFSQDVYPRKRRSPAKENVNPQTLFRVFDDANEIVTKERESPAFASALRSNKTIPSDKDSSKKVLDLFSAVFRRFRDGDAKDPIAAMESVVNEKSEFLGDIERARAFDVLAEIRTLMVANVESRAVLSEKRVLEQELKELREKASTDDTKDSPAACDCSGNSTKAGALVEEIMAELVSAQERLTKEEMRCQELENEKSNSQQMAAEELDCLRGQLEALQFQSTKAQTQFNSEKRQLEAALEKFRSEQPQFEDGEKTSLCSRTEELEGLIEEMKASQTVLQMAVAERDEEIASLKSSYACGTMELETRVNCLKEEKTLLHHEIEELEAKARKHTPMSKESTQTEASSKSTTVQSDHGVADKLAGELQQIMQELTELQSDLEQTAQDKEELQAERDRISEELEESQRQGYEKSEALIEKEHIAKVLQAQLNAKLMTISQLQGKHTSDIEALQQTIQDLTTEKEQLLAKSQEIGATPSTAESEKSASTGYMTDNDTAEADTEKKREMEAQELRSELDRLTDKLSTVETELVETKERLQAALNSSADSSEERELKAAFEQLKSDFEKLQEESKAASDALVDHKRSSEMPLSDDDSTNSLQQRYDTLSEEFKLVTEALKKVSCERNDCLDELRALESQLMEVSDEKMKLAVAADEHEMKLREAAHAASASSETIASLQAQLEEAQSAKATVETTKAELEQNVEHVQAALAALQADQASVVDQIQHRDPPIRSEDETGYSKVEQLQQRLEIESKQCKKLQLDVDSYEETLSMLRKEAKDSSDTIADLLEKMKLLESDLAEASRTQEQREKELSGLTNALTRSEEEMQEMRLQSKQRLVAAEGKEMELEEKISALQQQLRMISTSASVVSASAETGTQTELTESRERQLELQEKVTSLESELAEARQELRKQDENWNKKQVMAEKEFARLMGEQKKLRDQVASLQKSAEAPNHELEAQTEELRNAKQAYAELLEQKEALQQERDAAKVTWENKYQELARQLESIREQFQEAQEELEACQKSADDEIHRLRSVIEQAEADIEQLKHSAATREEELKSQIGEQEDWQEQVKSLQETLQAKCDELDDERRLLKGEYAALEAQRADVEEQLRNEISELSQKCSVAQDQQAEARAKLEQMESQLEMSEDEMSQFRSEFERLTELLKSSQTEAVQYHNQLVETQLVKESMDKLVEKQKARIDKLEKVKMTTETLDLFRKLKNDRLDLQKKVKELQKDLSQAELLLKQSQQDREESDQRLETHKDEQLKIFKEQVEELREALRVEKHQLVNLKTEMRAALNDEREKAEHEIQEMQALVKEKMDLVEQLEAQIGSVKDEMTKLREQKSDKVSYLEKENLDLHVENRELKKRLESSSLLHEEKEKLLGDTGTFDASAAEAVKMLGEVDTLDEGDACADNATKTTAQTQSATKVGGFLLSATELDAIAADSQDEPKEAERPECSQQ